MDNAPATQVHEILTYTRVSDKLASLSGAMGIETRGPLIKALNRLSCIPFVSFPVYGGENFQFVVGGEEAGTMCDPKIDVISKHSKASHFGKGEQTVLDETYRRGQEVTEADIKFSKPWQYENGFISQLEKLVSAALFVPRFAKVKLYKLAIYREGGHFDWHVDTTHSDSHHATVLVALNTSWTGGDFILRRNGVETRMDMKPETELLPVDDPETQKPYTTLQAVAFYTDTEHRVEPITDGVRIILQYDVEVEGWSTQKKTKDTAAKTGEQHARKKHKARHADAVGQDDDDDDDDDMDVDEAADSQLDNVKKLYQRRKTVITKSLHMGDPAVVDEIVDIIRRLLAVKKKDVETEVAFALQYLYRKSSILPEYLKGSDSLLYQTLSKTFEVSLHPVVLYESTDYEGCYGTSDGELCAYIFPHTGDKDKSDDEDDEDSSDEGRRYRRYRIRGEDHDGVFHLPRSSAIRNISKRDYVEHAGNEAINGEGKYFGGGMFVKSKAGGNA